MSHRWRCGLGAFIATLVLTTTSAYQEAAARPGPSPSPSPTNPPTPYMPVEQVANGTWDVIMQGREVSYSSMKLTDVGTTVNGVWKFDKKTTYTVSGTREGPHLKLDIKRADKADAVVGSIDATIDGIADMFGTITLGGVDTPFQGAQHSRVPPPVESSPVPGATRTPY